MSPSAVVVVVVVVVVVLVVVLVVVGVVDSSSIVASSPPPGPGAGMFEVANSFNTSELLGSTDILAAIHVRADCVRPGSKQMVLFI